MIVNNRGAVSPFIFIVSLHKKSIIDLNYKTTVKVIMKFFIILFLLINVSACSVSPPKVTQPHGEKTLVATHIFYNGLLK